MIGPDAEFRAHLVAGRFMLQQTSDGQAIFPPRIAAPVSGTALDWVAASGLGTVYATTVVRKKPPEPNYNVVIVELAEGPRMMSRVDGIDPTSVKIGLPVVARIIVENELPIVVFEPRT